MPSYTFCKIISKALVKPVAQLKINMAVEGHTALKCKLQCEQQWLITKKVR